MIFRVLQLSVPYLLILGLVLMGVANSFMLLFSQLPRSHLPNGDVNLDFESHRAFNGGDNIWSILFGVYTSLLLIEYEVSDGVWQMSH